MKRAAGMSTAVEQPGSSELDEIRFHWGSAYEIDRDGTGYAAIRRDGLGGLASQSLKGLLAAIRIDYYAVPVPRSGP